VQQLIRHAAHFLIARPTRCQYPPINPGQTPTNLTLWRPWTLATVVSPSKASRCSSGTDTTRACS
jgi:hypothetical protein